MRVHSIFQSIDGEVNLRGQGCLTTFIRLAGCNLSCNYCDAQEAQDTKNGVDMMIDAVVARAVEIGCPNITITGGEPLLQIEEVAALVRTLSIVMLNASFSIETNGTINPFLKFSKLSSYISFVVDYKLPSSGMEPLETRDILPHLRAHDWIKFVIANETDYAEAKRVVKEFSAFKTRGRFAFSPVDWPDSGMSLTVWANKLVGKMLEDKLWRVSLNCQLHKLVNLP